MSKGTTALLVIIGVVALLIGFVVGNYNGMVEKGEKVDAKFADIDTQLQRRKDLVPNLVNSVKGYTSHEDAAIDKVTEARAKLAGAKTVSEKAEADQQLTTALNNLYVIVENYPDLKADTVFIGLMDELAGTENRIATARIDYNDAVKDYNACIKKMPNSIIAGIFNFKEKEYFKAAEGANEVPEVSFE